MLNKNPEEYLNLLNPQQRDAVVYHDGPELVIAGAGSGKTRVLTYKIVDLINNGFEPHRIMALTFTNKAAREMKERIATLAGEKLASRLWMGTFHSIFLRLLRSHADRIGFNRNFTIYDASDSKSLIKTIIKYMGLDDKVYKPSTIASIISNAKNALVTPMQYLADFDNMKADEAAKRPATGRIYEAYCQRLRYAQAMDFDDILLYMNILLRDNADVLEHYRDFFQYILVDEYQDTNFAQHLIIRQLSMHSGAICVVGDDAQSIYSFRGANLSNILNLEKQYPGLKIFKLERNYRSTQNIINAAGSLICKNVHQMDKTVYSENEVGEPVKIVRSYSDYEESSLVANMIAGKKFQYKDNYNDYAVLYRTNAQSRVLEEALRRKNIPYRIHGGLSFYQRKEIKDAICYFRLIANPDDDEALARIINFPARGIGETTLRKLREAASASGVSLHAVISEPVKYGLNVNSGTLKKLANFNQLIGSFISMHHSGMDAYTLGQTVLGSTGIMDLYMHDKTPESISKKENLAELLAGLKDFVDTQNESGNESVAMTDFLSTVALSSDQDENAADGEPRVTLMTVHAAKGLEFNHVFIVGAEEELFPSARALDSMAQVEEERRLMYVAVTRAKLTCTISYANSRFRNGMTVLCSPSRFLSEFNPKYISSASPLSYQKTRTVNPLDNYIRNEFSSGGIYRNSPFSVGKSSREAERKPSTAYSENKASPDKASPSAASASDLKIGMRVRHAKFGEGSISAIEKKDADTVLIVNFDNTGSKKLLLRFAKIEILN